jgi:hypothetical protein
MIFHLHASHSHCPFRISGRLLARTAGLKGFSLAALSTVLGIALRFPKGVM